jgi:hypothetical protein
MLKVGMPDFGNDVKIDFNYEVAGLDKDRKRISSITGNYGQVFDLFKGQAEKLFAG